MKGEIMFRFKEIREVKREEKNLGFDPDVLIEDENERRIREIIRQAQDQADQAWQTYMVDKLIER